jgi:hypothetical protein
MEPASHTRVVDPPGLLEHLLRTHLPIDALDLPVELGAASARDLILRDLGPDLEVGVEVCVEVGSDPGLDPGPDADPDAEPDAEPDAGPGGVDDEVSRQA